MKWREAHGLRDPAPADREHLPLQPTLPKVAPNAGERSNHDTRPPKKRQEQSRVSSGSAFSGDAARLQEAVARQAADPANREQIRAQLNQSLQAAAPAPRDAVPVALWGAEAGLASHARRGPSSAEHRSARPPKTDRRGTKMRNQPRAFTPIAAPSALPQIANQAAEDDAWQGW
jgi:hypothetical protein